MIMYVVFVGENQARCDVGRPMSVVGKRCIGLQVVGRRSIYVLYDARRVCQCAQRKY
jgi:hypothetical protein